MGFFVFAEYISIPVSKLSHKPANVSYEHAAAIAAVGCTAIYAIHQANLNESSRVLILGGSTAVGIIAIQLAKAIGAWVATTASSRAVDFVSQFGVDHVINYNETNWWEAGIGNFDFVYSCTREEGLFEHVKTPGLVKKGV